MNNKIFLFVFICLMLATTVFAIERPLEVDYPEFGGYEPTTVEQTLLPDYIKYLFNFSLIIVGLIVFAALIIGGFLYLISSGDPTKLGDAKDRIFGALTGMVLLLTSWLILNTINPQLTIFYPIGLEEVSIYQGQPGTVTLFAETNCENINMYPKCDDENPCIAEETECFDIFKTGEKRCVLKDRIINLSKYEYLEKLPFKESDNWDNKAWSIIYYGDNYKTRVCDSSGFKNCEILTQPKTCRDTSFAISSVEVITKVNGARLYTEANFGGDYQNFPFDENNICYTDLSYIGDNQASSIEVDPGYWTVTCKMSNGDCGWAGESIIYDNWPEGTGYGDANLESGENYVGNSLSKICVMKYGSCGGILVWDGEKSDFFPKGKQYQLATDSLINNNAIEEIYQYDGDCEIRIWENAGLGNQAPALGPSCHTDKECCGRQWTSEFSDWSSPDFNKFIRLSETNHIYDIDKVNISSEYECPETNECCKYDDEGDCVKYCSACECDAYKYTFPDKFPEPFEWPDGEWGDKARCTCATYKTLGLFNMRCTPYNNCCGCESDLDNCCSRNDCNYDNAVHKKASCIQVLD